MTEPSDGLLLVQVRRCSLHSPEALRFYSRSLGWELEFLPNGDHLSVDPKGFIPGNGGGGRRALVQLVQLVGVVVEGRLSGDSSLLLTRPEDPTKERRLPLSLSPEGAGQ